MKILFAAPFTYNNITFFISNFYEGLASSAKQQGHKVRLLQTTDTSLPLNNYFQRQFNIFNHFTNNIAYIPNDLYLDQVLNNEVDQFRPDILFLHIINSYDLSECIRKIRKKGTTVLTWLGVHPSVVSPGIHKILKSSDHTLIYDDSYTEYYSEKLGINNILIISLGCNTEYFDNISPDADLKNNISSDISFIGMFDTYRGNILNSLTDFNLGIWSWNIDHFNTQLNKFYKGTAYGDELVKVLKSSKIALNIHREYEISGGNYRLFEIPASKTFQLVDEKRDIGKYFNIGEEIITFKNAADLRNKIEYYLKNEKERDEIALAGYNRVKKEHNLTDRFNTIIRSIKLN